MGKRRGERFARERMVLDFSFIHRAQRRGHQNRLVARDALERDERLVERRLAERADVYVERAIDARRRRGPVHVAHAHAGNAAERDQKICVAIKIEDLAGF